MKQPTNGELHILLKSLNEKVGEGFKGVHSRQDTANHGIKKNTEHRLKVEGSINTFKWLFGILGLGNIVIIIKVLLL